MADDRKPQFDKGGKMFPGQGEEVSRKLKSTADLANLGSAQGNLGDSWESRLMAPQLGGGGNDQFAGQNGYIGEFLGQPHFDGQDGTLRSPNAAQKGGMFGKMDETRKAWLKMKMVHDVYENDGQVASIIDLMADFATEGLQFIHGQDSVQKFYEAWAQKVKIKSAFRQAIIELLNAGNVFLYKVFARLDAKEERAMKSFTVGQRIGNKFLVTDEDGEQTLVNPKIEYDSGMRRVFEAVKGEKLSDAELKKEIKQFVVSRLESKAAKIIDKDIKPGAKKVVPWKYVALNPCQIIPDDESGGWVYLLTKDEVRKLLNQANIQFNESNKSIRVTMPNGPSGAIKESRHPGFWAEMKLQDERLVVLQYNKKSWKKWATGLTWKAMPTITFKNTLRAMENKTARAGINTVILWKIGDHKEGLIPEMEDYERLADMIKAPASTMNVIWNSAIEAEVIQPKIKDIFDPKRWEELRKEVTGQFGITQSVVTGEGGNFSSSFISVQGLLEKLETVRDILMEEWLMEEIFVIQKAMGFRKLPSVQFGQMSLRDQNAENTFLLNLYDRGLVSDTSLYEVLKRKTDIERDRLLNEYEWEDEHNFDRRGPFIKDPQQHVLDEQRLEMDAKNSEEERGLRREEMDFQKQQDQKKLDEDIKLKKEKMKQDVQLKKQSLKQKKTTQKGPNGRPPGSKGPQQNKRPSKPKNVARVDVEKIVATLDQNAKDFLVADAGVRDYRGLSKEDKDKVLDLVCLALAEMDERGIDTVLDPSYMERDLETSNTEFAKDWLDRGRAFMAEHKRKPRKAEIYQLFVDTYMNN